MERLHIITPVKDSIDSTLETAKAILSSSLSVPYSYTIYNDFSSAENTARLKEASQEMGFALVNLSDITSHPSPNYLLVLKREREQCLKERASLIIVESDVTVRPDTLQGLVDGARAYENCGIAASVTVNEAGEINYPYLYAKEWVDQVVSVRKHCSFCCSLLTPALMEKVDFNTLDSNKDWFDVTISHRSLEAGLQNYLFTTLPVLHRPHGSRPWKQLKYSNPLKYYWLKLTKRLDKI